MPAKRLTRPAAKQQLVTGSLADDSPEAISRLISDVATAHRDLADRVRERSTVTVTLAAGATVINHGLGRRPQGASVTPTVADAAFAWALTSANDKQATITTVGATQPDAPVEFY